MTLQSMSCTRFSKRVIGLIYSSAEGKGSTRTMQKDFRQLLHKLVRVHSQEDGEDHFRTIRPDNLNGSSQQHHSRAKAAAKQGGQSQILPGDSRGHNKVG